MKITDSLENKSSVTVSASCDINYTATVYDDKLFEVGEMWVGTERISSPVFGGEEKIEKGETVEELMKRVPPAKYLVIAEKCRGGWRGDIEPPLNYDKITAFELPAMQEAEFIVTERGDVYLSFPSGCFNYKTGLRAGVDRDRDGRWRVYPETPFEAGINYDYADKYENIIYEYD